MPAIDVRAGAEGRPVGLTDNRAVREAHKKARTRRAVYVGCGSRIWTYDLQVMSLTSYRAAPSRATKMSRISTEQKRKKADIRRMNDSGPPFELWMSSSNALH
jgi:hypothetical protein